LKAREDYGGGDEIEKMREKDENGW